MFIRERYYTARLLFPLNYKKDRPLHAPKFTTNQEAEKKNTDITNPICCSGMDRDRMRIGSAGDTSWPPSMPTEDTNKMDRRVESILGVIEDLLADSIYFCRPSR